MKNKKIILILKIAIMAIVGIVGSILQCVVLFDDIDVTKKTLECGSVGIITVAIEAFLLIVFFEPKNLKKSSKVSLIARGLEDETDEEGDIGEVIKNLKIYNSVCDDFDNNNI